MKARVMVLVEEPLLLVMTCYDDLRITNHDKSTLHRL